MASNAEFSIDGDPFANLGHDAINSEVLTLALEDLPALDVFKTVWEVVQKTEGAPDIAELGAIGGGGAQPTPTPQDTLDITMPAAGTHSYILGIAIRNAAGLRKIPPAETTQFDATYGWSASFSEAVDATPATPAVTVDNRVARFDGTLGNVQNTGLSITDADRLDGPAGAGLDLNAVTGQAVALQVNAVDVLRVLAANVEVAQRILAAAATDLDLDAPTGQTVNLQVNNTDVLTASGTAITAAQKVTGAAASQLELNAVTGQGVELQVNDAAVLTALAASVDIVPALLQFAEATAAPFISQEDEPTGAGEVLRIEAQAVGGTAQKAGDLRLLGGTGNAGGTNCSGGHAYIGGGEKTGSGLRGNLGLGLGTNTSGWNGAEGIVWIDNATTLPSNGSSGGVYLFSVIADLHAVGSSGLTCLLAPAGESAGTWFRHQSTETVTALQPAKAIEILTLDVNDKVAFVTVHITGRNFTTDNAQSQTGFCTIKRLAGTVTIAGSGTRDANGEDFNFAFDATPFSVSGDVLSARIDGFANAGFFEVYTEAFITAVPL